MANIEFAYVFSGGISGGRGAFPLSIVKEIASSEALTGTSGSSSIVAPTSPGRTHGTPIARVYSDTALKVRFASSTPSGSSPYAFIPAETTMDFDAVPGSKLYFEEA